MSVVVLTADQYSNYIQGDQLNMDVFFWYAVCDLFSVHVYSDVNWTSHFIQATRKTRKCLTNNFEAECTQNETRLVRSILKLEFSGSIPPPPPTSLLIIKKKWHYFVTYPNLPSFQITAPFSSLIFLKNIESIVSMVVCPNFGHPYLNSSF